MNEREGKAAIRILGAVARADKKIDEREKAALKQALIDFQSTLPDGTTIESLLSENIDLDAQLAVVKTPVARRAVFEAAVAMSIVDGTASAEENEVIARIRSAFSMDTTESVLQKTFWKAFPGAPEPVLDAEVRQRRVDALRATRATWAAIFGAIPFPFVGQVGVLMMFDSVTRDIAALWGHNLTRKERIARFGALVSFAIAQGALQELLKLVPGWGTAAGSISGGVIAFTATWALARAVNHHFEQEGKTTTEELKAAFAAAKDEGKKAFEDKKDDIERGKQQHGPQLAELSKKLEAGEITPDEFDQRISDIASQP